VEDKAVPQFRQNIQPLLAKYCYDCHGDGMNKGKVAFDELTSNDALLNPDLWLKVIKNVRAGLMPPQKNPRPTSGEVKRLEDWIKSSVFKIDPKNLDPGRVTVRRLNRVEYRNTIRDLIGFDYDTQIEFPPDDTGNGFDNNGDLLSLSAVRVDQYRQAAEALAKEALQPPLRDKLLTCDPATGDTCLTTFVTAFGERAYRRPLGADEVASYLDLASKVRAAGANAEELLSAVVQAFLVSPHFLFRVELDPQPTSLAAHALAPFELASRLSYMVYASMPDDALSASAKSGKLSDPAELTAQLGRMLADQKGRFAQNFAEQWLGVRTVDTLQPDAQLFPTFNPALGQSMKQEVDLFFDDFVRNDLPLESLLTASFTYLDDRLAQHYGVASVGATMKRVDLTTPQRGGLLTLGALLTATSRGNRTSPVSRGRWTLSELLCSEPPPPPADVKVPSDDVITATTARDFLAAHRQNATCATCHNMMDPVGLALENYDAVGAWRTTDHNQTIDASGSMPDGTAFNGPKELAQIVAKDARFRPCLSGALLKYSLGRGLHDSDVPYVTELSQAASGASLGLRELLTRVVTSEPFRQRHGEADTGGMP